MSTEGGTSTIPVIVCSVLHEPQMALARGAAAYLQKPISPDQLRDRARRLPHATSPLPVLGLTQRAHIPAGATVLVAPASVRGWKAVDSPYRATGSASAGVGSLWKVKPAGPASTRTWSPSPNSPASKLRLKPFSSWRWISRRSGRAP